ncbi:MAG: 16S rRNA processing protein RimM [Bacteroidetes bacterium]|nr:16S rRNA processing protein RimM [Bacteroidota bacterium]
MPLDDLFRIGRVSNVDGNTGVIKVKVDPTFTAHLSHLTKSHTGKNSERQFLFIEHTGKPVPYLIESIQTDKSDKFQFVLEDIHSGVAANLLLKRNAYMEISRDSEISKTLNKYLILNGFRIVDQALGDLGEVVEILEMPMQSLARVIYREKEILIPLNENTVTEIDKEEKVLYMTVPEGLLDI